MIPSTKFLYFSFLIFATTFSWSQETFTSPFTQSMDDGTIEAVNRKIVIASELLTIISDTPEGKDIQSLEIVKQENNEFGRIFYCTSKDGQFKSIAELVQNDGAPYLNIFYTSQNYSEKKLSFRILLD